jgi:hypothetical protein
MNVVTQNGGKSRGRQTSRKSKKMAVSETAVFAIMTEDGTVKQNCDSLSFISGDCVVQGC